MAVQKSKNQEVTCLAWVAAAGVIVGWEVLAAEYGTEELGKKQNTKAYAQEKGMWAET